MEPVKMTDLEPIKGKAIHVVKLATTGTRPGEDELLQACVLDARNPFVEKEDGKKMLAPLYMESFKPVRHTAWPDAEKRNGISPDMVKGEKPFDEESRKKLAGVLAKADALVFYSSDFDISFLRALGVPLKRSLKIFDVMQDWSIPDGRPKGNDVPPYRPMSELAEKLGIVLHPGTAGSAFTLRNAFIRMTISRDMAIRHFASWTEKEEKAFEKTGIEPACPEKPGEKGWWIAPAADAVKTEAASAAIPRPATEVKAVHEETAAGPAMGKLIHGDGPVSEPAEKPEVRAKVEAKLEEKAASAPAPAPTPGPAPDGKQAEPDAKAAPGAPREEPEQALSASDRKFYNAVFLEFEEQAKAGFQLPGNAKLRVSVRLKAGRVVCMAGIDDPNRVIYCEGKAPVVQSRFLFRGGADGNPAGVVRAFIAKLQTGKPERASEHARMNEIPEGLRSACARFLRNAAAKAEAMQQKAMLPQAEGDEESPRPSA